MTRAEFVATLETLGWTTGSLARLLGCSHDRVRNWTRATYRVPQPVAAWLQRRVEAHQRMMRDDPPPGAAP